MRIAVIGSGVSGLGAALALTEAGHETHLFESGRRFGGHSHTIEVASEAGTIPVDIGFIVYNEANYPNLTGLFEHLGVETRWSDMSFGFSLHGGRMEWAGDGLDSVFAQRRNALNPRFVRGVLEILRFNRVAREQLGAGALEGVSLGDWLARERFSAWFRDCYILPMGGAIWSTPLGRMLDFPMQNFAAFFDNHDLLKGMAERRRWRTVAGGSREYVARIIARLGDRAHAVARVTRVDRSGGAPRVVLADGSEAVFDEVVLACHAPSANRVVLHSDPALMPVRRKVWSSWNFLSGGPEADACRPTPVTYWMQRLQGIHATLPLFVSLNPGREPDPARVHAVSSCDHPVMDHAAFAAQAAMARIQGRGGIWYAGAWLGYGFHEDGLRSGLAVAHALGARPDWAKSLPAPAARRPVAEAAA
jgi:predicted NAD/FAD-binding protein